MRLAVLLALVACGRDRDNSLAELVEPFADKLPGLQIVVEHDGKIVLDRGFGFADLENEVPVGAETIFAIGSISKQFGAAAIMQLVEAGKLSLDDKLAKFYPAFPRAQRITIKDLLRHTSGIEDFEYTGPWPKTMAVERTDDEVVALVRDRRPLFEPNHGWSYSTSGYLLLGMIIEKVSGQPIRTYLAEHVFAPAGLSHTRYCDPYELIPHRARGYDGKPGAYVPAKMAIITQFGIGGGLCSTARDLLAWQKALESGRVVTAASYRAMATALPLADGTPTGYGYGLFPTMVAAHRVIAHSGGVSGFGADLVSFPDDGLRIAALSNQRGTGPPWFPIAQRLLEIEPALAKSITAAELERYVKTIPLESPAQLRVAIDGDHHHEHLVVAFVYEGKELDRTALVFVGAHTFETADRSGRLRYTVVGDRVVEVEVAMWAMSRFARF